MNQAAAQSEMATKLGALRAYLEQRGLAAALLTRRSNFAWLTGGKDNYILSASEVGLASLLVTGGGQYLVTTNIEAPRVMDEELAGQGWESHAYNWYQPAEMAAVVKRLVGVGRLASDTPFPGAEAFDEGFAPLRYALLPQDIDRYRVLGAATAAAMEEACREIRPGQTEHELASALSGRLIAQGIEPAVLLVATDERIRRYRHPIPTNKRLDRHAMLVVGAQKWGLWISTTRFVHFGPLPDEIVRKQRAVCTVDASFHVNTRPGRRYGEIFRRAIEAYAATGFGDEWTLHHQGGPTGYGAREFIVTPETEETVLNNQAVAWNPSITGTKSEDTVIVRESGVEVLTTRDSWPSIEVEYEGQRIRRPAILQG